EERLGQEALDLTGAGHHQLVFLGQFVHAEDGDDVLQFLVALQHGLHAAGGVVVLGTDHQRVEETGGGVQGIHGGVDTQLGDLAGQYQGGVKVGEGGRRGRVGQVIRRYVHRLEGGGGAGLGGRDALPEHAHLLRQGRLVTHRGGHAAEQCRHYGARQGGAVDVLDAHQDVAAFVAEVFRHGQSGEGNPQTVAGGLVHLAVEHGHFVENTGVLHFVVEVVTFPGPLTDTGEHRQTGVGLGDVVDQLHQGHGLAHAGAAEEADLAALGNRHDQVDDLDAGFEDVDGGGLIRVGGRLAVNGHASLVLDGARFIHGIAEHVHDAAQGALADRHGDGGAGVGHRETPGQALGGTHGDAAHHAVTQLLLDFEGEALVGHGQCIIDIRHLITGKLHVDHGADDLNNTSATHFRFLLKSALIFQRRARLDSGRSANNFRQFLGNGRLTGLVVDQLQF